MSLIPSLQKQGNDDSISICPCIPWASHSHYECLTINLTHVSQFRAKIIFGLNALAGRSIKSDDSAVGAWNYTNAESFIRYTVEKNYTIHGWELGNK